MRLQRAFERSGIIWLRTGSSITMSASPSAPRKAECCPVCDLRKAYSPRRNKALKGDRAKRQIISSEGFIGSY
ncbi:hypothetical protein NPIL_302091 [Nephila pilipes]|uniref:Uncharacterized protein n=1 Tax=Nephila pilipes TaxID=299642 RepID=A0A8X6MCW7_NEPPI|nr:hypothetical protein NPIL_302091 [Nephila pilipes]